MESKLHVTASVKSYDLVALADEAEEIAARLGVQAASGYVEQRLDYDTICAAVRSGDELSRSMALDVLSFWRSNDPWMEFAQCLLRDDDPVVRHQAAFQLGASRKVHAVPALVEALRNDSEPLVRHEAAEALGRIGSASALAALGEALTDEFSVVEKTARQAIAEIHRKGSPAQ